MRGHITLFTNQRGVTLVELLIAAVLTIIVAAAAMEFYLSQHKTWLVESEIAEVQYNVRASLDEIASALRMGGYQVPGHPPFAVGNDTLIIYFRNEATAEVDTMTYYVESNDASQYNLYKKPKGGDPEVLAENVESLELTTLGPNLIDISITARTTRSDSVMVHGDGYRRRTFATQVRLRNWSVS